jgi:hypothetical protein
VLDQLAGKSQTELQQICKHSEALKCSTVEIAQLKTKTNSRSKSLIQRQVHKKSVLKKSSIKVSEDDLLRALRLAGEQRLEDYLSQMASARNWLFRGLAPEQVPDGLEPSLEQLPNDRSIADIASFGALVDALKDFSESDVGRGIRLFVSFGLGPL